MVDRMTDAYPSVSSFEVNLQEGRIPGTLQAEMGTRSVRAVSATRSEQFFDAEKRMHGVDAYRLGRQMGSEYADRFVDEPEKAVADEILEHFDVNVDHRLDEDYEDAFSDGVVEGLEEPDGVRERYTDRLYGKAVDAFYRVSPAEKDDPYIL